MAQSEPWSPERIARVGRNLRILAHLNVGVWFFLAGAFVLLSVKGAHTEPVSRYLYPALAAIYVTLYSACVVYSYQMSRELGRFGLGWAIATGVSGLLVFMLPLVPVALFSFGRSALEAQGLSCLGFGPELSSLEGLENQRHPSNIA